MPRSSVEPDIRPADSPPVDSIADRLDSWKEIAAYLGRGVRTVQRWERDEGLPVHRLAHEKRGSVYAIRHEVAAWWESRRQTLTADATDDSGAERSTKLQRVTRLGAATFWPALSSDGRMVAYVSDGGRDGATPQIWVQQIGGAGLQLTRDLRGCKDVSFALRDTCLVFSAEDDVGQHVYQMPTFGGEPRLLRRSARGARVSPDGKWLSYVSLESGRLLRIDALDRVGVHKITPALVDVSSAVWSDDSAHLVVQAHPDATLEPEFWIVPIDGGPLINTGVMQRLRQRGLFLLASPPAWVGDSLIFSVITGEGIHVWRQRLTAVTFQPIGDPERLTGGTDLDEFPAAAAGRLIFVSTHPDQNLWSIPVDASGVAHGAPRRMTRGPGAVMYLSVARDGELLSYFATRGDVPELRIRRLRDGSERALDTRLGDTGFPAISPSGEQLAFGVRTTGPQIARPIYVAALSDESVRLVGDDCNGRPCQWLDERRLLIDSPGSRLKRFAILDTVDGARTELVSSAEPSVANPRVSPDGRWIVFDATRAGSAPNVIVAPIGNGRVPVAERDWMIVAREASHPFWSADGKLLYYLPTTPTFEHRNVIKARRFDADAGVFDADSFAAFASSEMVVPAMMNGCVPVAVADQIVVVLGDFRGDVWMLELDGRPNR